MLESFPGTGEEIDNIERAWAYGVSFFLKRTKTEKEKEQEFDKLRMRCEQAENELRFLKSKNGDHSSQSPSADDLFFSKDYGREFDSQLETDREMLEYPKSKAI